MLCEQNGLNVLIAQRMHFDLDQQKQNSICTNSSGHGLFTLFCGSNQEITQMQQKEKNSVKGQKLIAC